MKTSRIISALFIAGLLLMMASTEANAQRGRSNARSASIEDAPGTFEPRDFCSNIPNITEEQRAKINELRTVHLKDATQHRNKMAELRARKRTLMSGERVDLKEIDKIIDEMSALQNAQMKSRAKHHQEIRNLLTEEQRVFFDARGQQGDRKMMKKGQRRMHR